MTHEPRDERPLLNFEESLEFCLKPFAADEDIVQENISLQFNDPISFVRIQTACRTVFCDHVQCFDYNCYAALNSRRQLDDWACPICRALAPPEFVYVDYIFTCLVSLLQNFEGATVYSSGSFEGKKPAEQKEQSSVTIIDLVSDDETDQQETKTAGADATNFLQKLKDFPELKDRHTMSIAQIKSTIALRGVLRLMNHLQSAQLKRFNGVGDKLAREIVLRRPWAVESEADLLKRLQEIRLVGKKKAVQIVEQLKAVPNSLLPVLHMQPQRKEQPAQPPSAAQPNRVSTQQMVDALAGLRGLQHVRSSSPQPPLIPQQQMRQQMHQLYHQNHPQPYRAQQYGLPFSHFYAAFASAENAALARPNPTPTPSSPETVFIDVHPDVTTNENSYLDAADTLLDFQTSPPPDEALSVPGMEYYAATFGSPLMSRSEQQAALQPRTGPAASPLGSSSTESGVASPHKRPRTSSQNYPVTASAASVHSLPWSSMTSHSLAPGTSAPSYPPASQPCQYYALAPPQCSYPQNSSTPAPLTASRPQAVENNDLPQIEAIDSELFDYFIGPFA